MAARALALIVVAMGCWSGGASALAASLTAQELAIVVNESDPLSVEIADYYRRKRGVPATNLIRVRIDPTEATLPAEKFTTLYAAVLAQTPPKVQAYALTWMKPYRVDCMSITTAFAAGFDVAFCAQGCRRTRLSPYFNSNSRAPYRDFEWRPTMTIAARDFKRARQLIDRGAVAGQGVARGRAYLVKSNDVHRNVRAASYADAKRMVGGMIDVEIVDTAPLQDRRDVMFYFIGAARVDKLETNRFLPGALADHLTSFGGALDGVSQMSSLHWLEAGAAGSYGTVVEPCNLPGKFPNVGLLMQRYLAGETLLEAYWKSVAMPGQGLFIGDPLARPYGARSADVRVSSW